MRRMWLGLEVVVVGLHPLIEQIWRKTEEFIISDMYNIAG